MKKVGFLFILILATWLILDNIAPSFQNQIEIYEEGREHVKSAYELEVSEDQIYRGNLLLVNKEYPVKQEGVKTDIVPLITNNSLLNKIGLLSSDIQLSEEITLRFMEMVAAANADGVNHFLISSGYREFDAQNKLFQEKGSDYALPAGYSEHQLGLALDVGSTQSTMEYAAEGKWIEDHSWKYGFVLRYPADKTAVTGIQYEPWHVRYVGLPHSAIMHEKNFVLEEYLDYLRDVTTLSVNVDGREYTVSYFPNLQEESITIQENQLYEISGNNVDGVILTEWGTGPTS